MAETRPDVVNSLVERLRQQQQAPTAAIQPEAPVTQTPKVRPDVVQSLTERLKQAGSPPAEVAPPEPVPPPQGSSPALGPDSQQAQAPVRAAPITMAAVEGLTRGASAIPDILQAVGGFIGRAVPRGYLPFADVFRGVEETTGLVSGPSLGDTTTRLAKKAVSAATGLKEYELEPQNAMERWISRVTQEVTGTALTIPLVRQISAATQAIPAGRFVTTEMLEGLMSGAGAATAREFDPNNPLAEIGAQLAPTALMMAVNLARYGARALGGRGLLMDREQQEAVVAQAIRDTMGDLDDPALHRNLQEVQESVGLVQARTGEVPTPSLGEATGSPGLLSFELRAQDEMPIVQSGNVINARNKTMKLYEDAIASYFPEVETGSIRSRLRSQRDRARAVLRAKEAMARGDLETAKQLAAQRAAQEQERITSMVDQANEAVRKKTDSLVSQSLTPGPERDIQSVVRGQEAASREIRRLWQTARVKDRSRIRTLYNDVFYNPNNNVEGPAPGLVRDALRMQDESLVNFQGADMPKSMREFFDSLRRRAAQSKGLLGPVPKQSSVSTDFMSFIRQQGGIKLDAEDELISEFNAVLSPKETGTTRLLNNKSGITPQEMAERAAEMGYIPFPDKQELLDTMGESIRSGRLIFPHGETGAFGEFPMPLSPEATANVSNLDLEDVPLSLQDLHVVRSRTLKEIRAMNPEIDANRIRLAEQFVDRIDRGMLEMANDVGRVDVLDQLRAANREFRKHKGLFGIGAGEKILRQKSGFPSMSVADVTKQFLDSPENAEQFVNAVGNVTQARQALETYLDHELYLKAVDPMTGRFNQAKADQWLKDRDVAVRFFPNLQAKYNDLYQVESAALETHAKAEKLTKEALEGLKTDAGVEAAQRELERRVGQIQRGEERLRQSAETFLGKPRGQDTFTRIQELLATPGGRLRLKRFARTLPADGPERQELGRMMYNAFMSEAEPNPLLRNVVANPEKMRAFINRNKDTLETIYGRDHVNNLNKITNGLFAVTAKEKSPRGLLHGSRRFETPGTKSVNQALLDAIAPVRMPMANIQLRLGRYSIRAVADWLIRKNVEELNQLTYEMMFDKDIAETFALLSNTKVKPRVLKARLRAHFAMLGAGARGDENEEIEE